MTQIALEMESIPLAELVQDAQRGEEIVFTQNSRPVARLVAVPTSEYRRKAGSAKHLPHFMAEDFDTTPEGFEEYMT